MAGMVMQTCMSGVFRPYPMNLILLVYFTLAWSGMVAGFCAFQEPLMVFLAALLTAIMTIALTLVALCVKSEMTWCYGIGATIIFAIWPAIIFVCFNPDRTRQTMLAFFGTIIASVYIIIDTDKIIGTYGNKDEYIFGAMMIYRDILVLFLSLL